MKCEDLNTLAEAASIFRQTKPMRVSNTRTIGLCWPTITKGAVFGNNNIAAFYAGSINLPDGWLVPKDLNVAEWLDSFNDIKAACKIETEALKCKQWRYVKQLDPSIRVPPTWKTFESTFTSVSHVSINPDILVNFVKATGKLSKLSTPLTLVPSNSERKPMHVFVGYEWRGVIMPIASEHPTLDQIPKPIEHQGSQAHKLPKLKFIC